MEFQNVKTVIYNATAHKAATAQITFNEESCKVAGIELAEYVIEKLLVNPNPSEDSFHAGWNSDPEIQFTNGRVISQNYSSEQGDFKLFEYQVV
jgi:hypothetical protein